MENASDAWRLVWQAPVLSEQMSHDVNAERATVRIETETRSVVLQKPLEAFGPPSALLATLGTDSV